MAVSAQSSFNGSRSAKAPRAAGGPVPAPRPLPATLLALLQEGLARHQAGRLDEAIELYQRVLKERPTQPDALHLSGVIHHQRGDSKMAVKLIRKALKGDPSNANALVNLGAALTALERWEEAGDVLQEAVSRLPNSAEAQGNLGAAHERAGRLSDAASSYRRASELNPANPQYLRRWADSAYNIGVWQEAATAFDRYLQMVPGDTDARNNMGLALQELRRTDQAIEALQRSLADQPDNAMIHANLGNALGQAGRLVEAEIHFRRSVELAPDDWRMQINLVNLLWELGRIDEAFARIEKVIATRPDDAQLLQQTATRLTGVRHYERAEQLLKRAIEIDPNLAEAYNGLGNIAALRFDYAGSIGQYSKAIELKPDHLLAHLNLCMALLKLRRFDEAAIRTYGLRMQPDYAKHEAATLSRIIQILKIVADFDGIELLGDFWPAIEMAPIEHLSPALLTLLSMAEDDEHIERMVAASRRVGVDLERKAAWKVEAAPAFVKRTGKIRIGLVSADFRSHSAARCILPLLRGYDRDRFELTCYSAVSATDDPVQRTIMGLSDAFVEIDAMDDPAAADRMRADGMEVLFDLSGWTAYSRLPLFAYKPAPHQVSWLGWPFTSGLPSIGHFLVDRFNAPTRPGLLVESPLVMDGSWVCFENLTQTPIGDAPFKRNGHITFGTLNNTYKVSQKQIALWARIMAAVPGSRFLMARAEVRSLVFCRNMLLEFSKYGIGEDRLELIGQAADASHFDFYNQFDVSLDTYPVVGGVTTMDSLWMGVPVVAMYGAAFHQRIGHSILNHCGLGEFSVPTPEAFVETACRLAADTDRLAEMRTELRSQVAESPLLDVSGFAARFGAAIAGLVAKSN
ncbi:O-linked N-acetylglucosamine transferase family protein [Hypericibacter adhaerens]|uniref:O-linked N-acetylglucosamine transferase family protein n=1 Tax=Hypericibacter adhaerens TaxID=2602016 RepID=UPI0012462F6B|nr:tetratricopeptide repeat protein [Hypericibacter adhaerens]